MGRGCWGWCWVLGEATAARALCGALAQGCEGFAGELAGAVARLTGPGQLQGLCAACVCGAVRGLHVGLGQLQDGFEQQIGDRWMAWLCGALEVVDGQLGPLFCLGVGCHAAAAPADAIS